MSKQRAAEALHGATPDPDPETLLADALQRLGLSESKRALIAELVERLRLLENANRLCDARGT